MNDVERAIDDAFHFRGHVAVTLRGGERLEGYLFNRDLAPRKGAAFLEMFLKGSGAPRRIGVAEVERVERTGEDCAQTIAPKPAARPHPASEGRAT